MGQQSDGVRVRLLTPHDSLQDLTDLVHRAYAQHLAQGLNFSAATQTLAQTRARTANARCLVAERVGGTHKAAGLEGPGPLLGTVTVSGPWRPGSVPASVQVPWYFDPQIAHLHQFAVDPVHQGLGIGRRLALHAERWAQQEGFVQMALDTAQPATALCALYRRWGYTACGHIQWPGKTYASVVMVKALVPG
jgi:GNAT superfamily N-acetyltransferase